MVDETPPEPDPRNPSDSPAPPRHRSEPASDATIEVDPASLSSFLAGGSTTGSSVPGSSPSGGSSAQGGLPAVHPDRTLGPYRIHRLLGRGGMGEVYEAEHIPTNHRIALKVLSAESSWSPERRARFLQEGRLAASISDPHSLYVYGTDEIDGTPVISMELADGGTLKDLVESKGPLSVADAVEAAIEILQGLAAAHRAGVLHRDVKPANIFVDRDGSMKVGDYGLSKTTEKVDNEMTTAGTIVGTPAFASPEQLRGGDIDARSDLYAVGATLYYVLTGKIPYAGAEGLQMIIAIIEKPVPDPRALRPDIPEALAMKVMQCMAKDPTERFQTCEAMIAALAPHGRHAPQSARFGRRLAAGIVDNLLVNYVFTLALSPLIPRIFAGNSRGWMLLMETGSIAAFVLYATLMEGKLGFTLGKAALQLRLVDESGRPPGLWRAFRRSAVFWSVPGIAMIASALTFNPNEAAKAYGFGSPKSMLSTVGMLTWILLFALVRRNRWAIALHDLWTRTRVVQPSTEKALLKSTLAVRKMTSSGPVWEIGAEGIPATPPVEAGIGAAGNRPAPGTVVRGIDSSVRRNMWIHICEADSPPVPDERRNVSRPGRLRWLRGARGANLSWDGYEAIEGSHLETGSITDWRSVRLLMLNLLDEIADPRSRGTIVTLSLDRIWIAATGRAVLLDFPADRIQGVERGAGAAHQIADYRKEYDPSNPADVQAFLEEFAHAAMGDSVRQPLPLHASRLLRDFGDRRYVTIEEIVGALSGILERDVRITRFNGAIRTAILVIPAVAMAAVIQMAAGMARRSLEEVDPNLRRADICLSRLADEEKKLKKGGAKYDSLDAAEDVHALKVLLSGPLQPSIKDTSRAFALSPNSPPRRIIHARAARRWVALLAESVATGTANVDAARLRVGPAVEKELRAGFDGGFRIGTIALFILTGLLAVLLSLLLRGGLLLRMFGVAVVRGNGKEAGRLLCLGRSAFIWLPVFLLWVPGYWALIPLAAIAAETASSLVRPERGIIDRAIGTWIVPK
jgi:eukaryotic-like serine/threonine-protein kinase